MSATLAAPFHTRSGECPPAARDARDEPIEIFASDRNSTELLLEYAAGSFPAEIAPGFVWIVRLVPPAEDGWAVEVFALLQQWLESARLPWANVLYRGRSCLIRASTDIAEFSLLDAP